MLKVILTLCVFVGASVNGQRVAPGVAPQHYQQAPPQHQQHPPPPQQYQQVHPNHLPPGVNPQQYQAQQQVQYQQVPVQQQQQIHVQQQVPVQQIPVHQQVPVQQVPVQQQQVPVQQVPQHGGHGHQVPPHHTGHVNHGQVLNAANIQNEKEHIQEHLHVPIDTSKMSEAELQFHYFKMHDSDNNNKLDGCELIKSLIHWHVDEEKDKNKPKEGGTGEKDGTTYTDENLADVIDYVLKTMDLNNDGYVDYAEYRKSEEESAKGNKQ